MQSRRIDDSDSDSDSDGDYVISTAFDFDCIVPDIDALNMDMDADINSSLSLSLSSSSLSAEKLGWRYAATEKLPQDAENHELLKHINLCPYLVNTEGPVPFLEYLLRKDTESSTIDFIHFALDVDSSSSVSDICESVLDIALDVFIMPQMTTKNTINTANRTNRTNRTNTPKYKYKGTVECDGDLYLFYDCSDYHIGVHSMTSFNDIWIVTLDEIINTKQCCQYTIHESVPHFFLRNTAFLTLTAATNKRHTHHAPSIFYSGQSRHNTDMAATFGIPRVTCSSCTSIEMYKFTSYWTAASIKAENQLWGVVRYAIFASNPMLVNNTNEKETNEKETNEKETNEKKRNNWHVQNDSVLVYNDKTPTLPDVYVKHFSDIVPLTIHYLPA